MRMLAKLMALAVFPAALAAQGADLTGAGATFPFPIYSKWFADYAAKTGVKINYQAIGSGGGKCDASVTRSLLRLVRIPNNVQ